jgi:hypothetical protein
MIGAAPVAQIDVAAPQPIPAGTGISTAPELRDWRPRLAATEPVSKVLREGVRKDRSTLLLRRLPAVISRLSEFSRTIPAQVAEALAGVFDAAVLADDYASVVYVAQFAETNGGKDGQFGELVRTELANPLRIAWLVERLRTGLPPDSSALRKWFTKLGPSTLQLMVEALEASDPGRVQELFADVVAAALSANPTIVTQRLEQHPKLRTVAALSYALERSNIPEAGRVFASLTGRREEPLMVELLTGRARARGPEAQPLLEAGLRSNSAKVRQRSIELVGELLGGRGFQMLGDEVRSQAFAARALADRATVWAALLACGGEAAISEVDNVLLERSSLVNRRVVDGKLGVIEGLARAKTETARAILERTANDRSQGTEVGGAARAALDGVKRAAPEDDAKPAEQKSDAEVRIQLAARITLDLAMLSRAATTVEVAGGLLDPAINRFREGLRQLHSQEGVVRLTVTPSPLVNGQPVIFVPSHQAVAQRVTKLLVARGFGGVQMESLPPLVEVTSLLLRAFDPEGRHERLPTIKAVTHTGAPLTPTSEAPHAPDPTARSRDIFSLVVRWLAAQRDAMRARRPLDWASVDPLLEEWALRVHDGSALFLGVARWTVGETGILVHAVNTALVSMAFGKDLGLTRSALREACELALVLGLAESLAPPSQRVSPAAALPEEQRFHAAGLLLTSRLNRIGTSAAVAAIDTGLVPDKETKATTILLASIHALARTYDALTAGDGATNRQAAEALSGKLRTRFNAEVCGLFTQWLTLQA